MLISLFVMQIDVFHAIARAITFFVETYKVHILYKERKQPCLVELAIVHVYGML